MNLKSIENKVELYKNVVLNARTIFSLFKKQYFSHFIVFEIGMYPIINVKRNCPVVM